MPDIRSEIHTVDGKQYRVRIVADDSHDPPWLSSDCHGVVVTRNEWNIQADDYKLLTYNTVYDFAASRKKALEVWGLDPSDVEDAVQDDYKYLKAYADGEWSYVGVIVSPVVEKESLFGIESNEKDYIESVIGDLIKDLQEQAK
jgi:hypothetical protein